jgi:hypothetical protein
MLIFIIHVHYGGYDIDINVYIINDKVVDGTTKGLHQLFF